MSNTLIILGAGASFDYINEGDVRVDTEYKKFKPPLSNDLFSRNFENLIKKYEAVRGLSASVSSSLKQGVSLEDHLLEIKDNYASTKDYFQKQLNALPFYLQELFSEITNKYGSQSSNNYLELKNNIKKYQSDNSEFCVVNFNYDLLFESEFNIGLKRDIEEYLTNKDNIKIIKIHGACNWKKVLPVDSYVEVNDSYSFLQKDPYFLTRYEKDSEIFVSSSDKIFNNNAAIHLYPTIAIPINNKNSFVCPKRHINQLISDLGKIDKILIIGWKATDSFLIDKLKENLIKEKEISVFIVTRDNANLLGDKEIDDIKKRLSTIENLKFVGHSYTFSDFVSSSKCDDFLKL